MKNSLGENIGHHILGRAVCEGDNLTINSVSNKMIPGVYMFHLRMICCGFCKCDGTLIVGMVFGFIGILMVDQNNL